jgi:hypothetical protein
MRIASSAPYRGVAAECVRRGAWQIVCDGEAVDLGTALEHWDQATDLKLIRQISVNVERVREDAGLPPDARIYLLASWQSELSYLRGTGTRIELPPDGEVQLFTIDIDLAGQDLSGSVYLRTSLVLGENLPREPLRAYRAGTLLWNDEVRLVLEGAGARFPMELVSFSRSGWQLPAGAAWKLEWDSEALELPVLGGLRLFLNEDHPRVQKMVTEPDSSEAEVMRETVHFDIGRQLIRGALESEAFLETDDWPEDSVGRMISRLLKVRFDREPPAAIRGRMRSSPEQFDAELQARLQAWMAGD